MKRRSLVSMLAAAPFLPTAAALAQTAPAAASWSPDRPIRFVVGFAPGGSTDTAGRVIAEAITGSLGQPIVVENRTGAAGNIGSEFVARSAPDGYTYIVASLGTHATNQFLYSDLSFHVVRDFAPVSLALLSGCILVVHPSVPFRSVSDLIAYAKANPGKLNLGTSGPGGSQHFAAALFEQQAGVSFTHVPYRGGAPAMADLVAGRLDVIFSPVVEAIQHVKGGQLRALGVTRQERAPSLPDIPTVGETVPGYVFNSWLGIFAPARTPAPIIARMSAEIAAAMRSPAVRERVEQLGYQPVGSTPEEFAAFQLAELEKVRELVRVSGASVN
ncbi:tripartite tricarboxylate transporter substrate binding protein [Siccirubricoccus sp. G192]|uniref:Bug family tripartite tricarboxylate transporter substrate binding protein n=1 Tax=Siccirubricoccus sp. G192 TaxID=2849651 RepID=UPI001C2C0EBC|nr:tripartite tricarboxylate transporter substrate binding protein [Siccirubricoccus sp. G192]MBV1799761.1 tripartite tricarboxylate transporter substrate binding protein [Siccirubricoccus sp. G192]